MTSDQWTRVDQYITDHLIPADSILAAALQTSAAAGLPQINVTASQGKLLYLLALLANACNILEIGTLGAYSTIWLARALPPDGHLITLEANEKHASIAEANLSRAGLTNIVELRRGPA